MSFCGTRFFFLAHWRYFTPLGRWFLLFPAVFVLSIFFCFSSASGTFFTCVGPSVAFHCRGSPFLFFFFHLHPALSTSAVIRSRHVSPCSCFPPRHCLSITVKGGEGILQPQLPAVLHLRCPLCSSGIVSLNHRASPSIVKGGEGGALFVMRGRTAVV